MDDEPAILSFSRLVFESEGTWDVSTAGSGEEAFSVLQHQPVDVILSDMRMPGMSGAELLRNAMELYPKASRIIMSGYSDAANIAKALGATHQFVAKPFQVKDLIATINRICALDELLLNDEVKSVIARMRTVPSLPSLYYRIRSVLEVARILH
ncbi:MAG: response regulator [Chthoniobacteraceae bacterium]